MNKVIEKPVHLTPQTARVLKDGRKELNPAEKAQVGDRIRVLPGERVSVDGVILSGSASIQRMIRLVQSTDAGKAKMVEIADRWATWIVVGALSAAGLTWLIFGEIIRAVTILVVFCPCCLGLATSTANMAAIGNVTKHGFLVREGDALEHLTKVSRIAFDKTDTLTQGTPEISAVRAIPLFTEKEAFGFVSEPEISELFGWIVPQAMKKHHMNKALGIAYEAFADVDYGFSEKKITG